MVLRAVNVNKCVAVWLLMVISFVLAPAQAPPSQQQDTFDASTASRLLMQLSEALEGHSQKQFLDLFDLGKMKDGTIFKQQITSFFSQTDSIRVHLNLLDTAVEGGQATLTVQAEMEADPTNGSAPSRRNDQLNFVVADSGAKWKIVDLQPRSFFSLP
jgi:hypothetical protein